MPDRTDREERGGWPAARPVPGEDERVPGVAPQWPVRGDGEPELRPEPAVAEPVAEPEESQEEGEAAAVAVPEPEPEPEPEPAPPDEPDSLEHVGGVFEVPDGYTVLEGDPFGGRRTVGVVVARFNREITKALLASALDALATAGVSKNAITVMPVPGAFELPIAAMALAKTRRYACVIALGCVIRGETPHFDFVAGEAASGLQLAAIETGVPVSFGLLTCESREQAEARVDRGADAARTALEMADVFAKLRAAAAAR